ncbi:hypothetical protein NHX12_013396 [Muraenolepis orangiensis]|uniref:Matrix remodeling-associated protein 8 n=1 Tax=Muraenolepis orangiensis TaxID=630683 RepID=A0A9Q0I6D6_9TELE|nr:hypothetical protein NHX12_013396 [Muraenolepis orangiensis]
MAMSLDVSGERGSQHREWAAAAALSLTELRTGVTAPSQVYVLAVLLLPSAWCQSGDHRQPGLVVEAKNFTYPAGSRAVLPCHSARMVWTRDRLRDRQRVVHWDLVRTAPDYSVERILDMSPGEGPQRHLQRVYNAYNKGRVSVPPTAFSDGNFSLLIHNVSSMDRGVYTCNLHHHYCQVRQSIKIQLNVTKSARKEKRFWDGERTVFVVLQGSSVALPCVNRRPLWRDGLQEDQQQVAHWDFQAPGVRQDRADRLVDLYASGEKREYEPLFTRGKMSLEDDAFTAGDFSLSIADLTPDDKGLYSCHLHHHYCGVYERRTFRLTVGPPSGAPLLLPRSSPQPPESLTTSSPNPRGHVMQQLGYILATFFLLALMIVTIVVVTRRRRKRENDYELRRYDRGYELRGGEVSLTSTELKTCNQEPLNSDYKNNLMKARDMSKGCNMDLEEKMWL